MGVKTYQAYTMAEALTAAKRDLGGDAIILETRTFRRGGLLGVGARTIFELTATTSDRAQVSRGARKRTAAAYARAVAPGESDRDRTRLLAQALMEAHERRGVATRRSGRPTRRDEQSRTAESGRTTRPMESLSVPPTPVARRFILTAADAAGRHRRSTGEAEERPDDGGRGPVPPGSMQEELAAIKTMVGRVLQQQARPGSGPRPDMPEALFEVYLELIGQDLSEELADRIVNAVREELPDVGRHDPDALRTAVLDRLADLVPAADPSMPCRAPDDRPLTIALIGPTGVGKTTTLAKLAAQFKLKQHRQVGLVTCDTYRIAAVDQLRTYANIIGLPLEVTLTAAQMKQAVHTLDDCDVILIDTAGRAPSDRGRLDELRRCLDAARPHEVHLVLSSTSSERNLLREAEAFADVGADRIVLTKLDEAVSFGVLFNVMQAVGKKLSFITTGQEVPDHIEAGRPRRLAELVLGAGLES